MSSSFVKDCSDVSAPGNSNSGKTVIIIVNNETGNVSLDGDELQNLLASHGADGSQVSVVRMGSGGLENLCEASIASIATSDGTQHVNLTVEGYPAIPVEGQIGGAGNYAELPLDADAFRRLESVLESEEAREILGEPLLNMVTNPEQLGTLDELMDSTLFEGESEDAPISEDGASSPRGGSPLRTSRPPPKRRSQRQMDKAEREEVEKILAENQKKLQEERQQLDENQVLTKLSTISVSSVNKVESEDDEDLEENSVEDAQESLKTECEDEKNETCTTQSKGKTEKPDEERTSAPRGKGRGRNRVRCRGKIEREKESTQEVKGKQKGKKDIEDPEVMAPEKDTTGGRGRGTPKEDVATVRGRGRGRGRGRIVSFKENNADVVKTVELENDKNKSIYEASSGLKMKELKVTVKKMDIEQTVDRKGSPTDENDSKLTEEECIKMTLAGEIEADESGVTPVIQEPELPIDTSKKKMKKPPVTPKVIPQFEPALFSTPDVMLKVGDVNSPQAIAVKGNGKPVKARKILLVKKIKKEIGEESAIKKEDRQNNVLRKENGQSNVLKKGNGQTRIKKKENGQTSVKRKEKNGQTSLKIKRKESGQTSVKRKESGQTVVISTDSGQSDVINSESGQTKVISEGNLQTSVIQGGNEQTSASTKDEKSNPIIKLDNMDIPKSDVSDMAENNSATSEVNWKDEKEQRSTGETSKKSLNDVKVNKSLEKRDAVSELRSKVIHVKSPMGVRQVVVLNSAKAGMYRETLVKVIPPKDPPREEEKISPAKQRMLAKKELHLQKKKIDPQKSEIASLGVINDHKIKDSFKSEVHRQAHMQKKADRIDSHKSGDPLKPSEEAFLSKKKEEALRRKEEIQQKRDEILRKREAIKKRKENTQQKNIEAVDRKLDNNIPRQERTLPNNEAITKDGEIKKHRPIANIPRKIIQVVHKINSPVPKLPAEDSPVRRSNRAIKKKTFGDEMLTFDLKADLVACAEEEQEPEEEFESEGDEDEDSLEDYGEDDDPERLWCVCQKPHNNRFMICCDKCEDWFHGSCVGVTKAIGQQMEEDGQEWVCPKCKKAERAMKGYGLPGKKSADGSENELPEILRHSITKNGSQAGNRSVMLQEGQTIPKRIVVGEKKVEIQQTRQPVTKKGSRDGHFTPVKLYNDKKMDASTIIPVSPPKNLNGGKECVVESCNKAPKADSIYCSNDCVLKHAQMSLKMLGKTDKVEEVQCGIDAVSSLEKSKPRVLVYHKSTGKILSGGEAPTLVQLKEWLEEHPDYAVLQPGMMGSSGTVISTNTQLSPSNFYGQKKVIQIPPKSVAAPISLTPRHKVAVVKPADVRIIVKTSETSDKEVGNKAVASMSMSTPTKSVVVSTTKPTVLPTTAVIKDGEVKKDAAGVNKKDETNPSKNTPAKENKKLSDSVTVLIQNKPASVEKKKPDPNEVRNNIKKTLSDCLIKRFHDAKNEFDDLNEDDIKVLAEEIERELYVFFGKDVGFKYKSRYRSILFNTKDTKNSGLFRKILNGTISPSNLVRMTSEELASKELCEWREREEKKELQAIEKYELDMIALGNQYIMKSHKGEIEIDKDEFIKDKEKAPETLNSLPADPVAEVLEDTTLSHANHMYDLNCKICTGKQDHSLIRQISKSQNDKSEEKAKKDTKDSKQKEAEKVKERKERKSSSDKDRRERRDSTDRERHRHKSKESDKDRRSRDEKNRDKEKERDNRDKEKDKDSRDKEKDKDTRDKEKDKDNRDKEREKEKSKYKEIHKDEHSSDRDKDKSRDKHRNSKDGERYKTSTDKEKKDKERRDSRDKKDDRDKKHRERHKDRRDSKDDRERKRRDSSEKSERKRKYSESRSEDKKRRESIKESSKRKESCEDEKQKEEVVSTSEDVVFDPYSTEKHLSSHLDSDAKDAEPTSTVIGSPEIYEIKDYSSPCREVRAESPPLFPESLVMPPLPPDSPGYVPPPPTYDSLESSPLPEGSMTNALPYDGSTTPPLPDYIPTTPPLPSEDIPSAPPLPEDESPCTPPPLPDDDIPCTPPLPDEDCPDTPPPPIEDMPFALPTSELGGSTTPPLPKDSMSLISSYSGSLLPPQQPSFLSDFNSDSDRLTPPPIGVQKLGVASATLPGAISAEPYNVWKGIIHMPDVAKFQASAFEVSGKAKFLPDDVPNSVEVVGRIAPDTVWSYIAQMKKSGSKEILVVRFQPANEEEKVSYIALYSYLSSKKRYAVIGNCEKSVKDFYVVPLASHQPIPQVLLPLDGPGFEEHRAHMLIGVIVRAKSKRVFDHVTGTWSVVGTGTGLPFQPMHKPHELPERSYTPPLPTDEDIQEIALAAKDSDDEMDVNERSVSVPKNLEETSMGFLEPGTLKRPTRDAVEDIQPKKRHIDLVNDSPAAVTSCINEEPNSPIEETFVEASLDQESMLAELNRQIEEHKKELSEMQKTIGNEDEEPYSPSCAQNLPSSGSEQLKLDTSKISIPSNLQEILDNIKQKEVEIKQKEQEIKRRLSLSSDPIVMNYGKYQDSDNKKTGDSIVTGAKADVDLRPLLQSKSSKDHKSDVDLRILKNTDDNNENFGNRVDSGLKADEDTDLRIRDPRLVRAQAAASLEKSKALSKMSDEELLAKASEMEENENINKPHSEIGAESLYHPVQPSFMQAGLASSYMPQGGPVVLPSHPPSISGHSGYIGAMGPPQPIDLYGSQPGRLPGPERHVPPAPLDHLDSIDHSGAQLPPPSYIGPHSSLGPHGPSRYSGAHGPARRFPGSGWEGGKSYNNRGWGHHYNKSRDRDRERDRDWERGRDWERDREWDRDWRSRASRDKGHSKFPHTGKKRREGKTDSHERNRDNSYRERYEREHPYEEQECDRGSPYPEIDY
ncbi:PHD finger protein 3 isoform X1 [Procambarus clarkii]|uniref:PHD finger protein 3 isoform X1 n=1 Tax=Procambarus clarkii TaxID=6728 RepID=UPI0037422B4C